MLVLLLAASLGGQACAPVQTLAEAALGSSGAVTTGPVAYPGQPDAPGCLVTLSGGSQLGDSFISVAAKLDQALTGAGWTRDLSADADGPDQTAAGYGQAGDRLAVSVTQSGYGAALSYAVVLGLQSAGGAVAEATASVSAVVLDPACLSKTAWAVDPASDTIQAFGCRPLSDIPAPDADGYISYSRPLVDGLDGGFTRVKASDGAPAGQVSFVVQDNTGGSFTAQATVTGVLGADGTMQSQGLSVQ